MSELFAPVSHIVAFADEYGIPRRMEIINRIRRTHGYPEFVAIGPGASLPLPDRRIVDVMTHRKEMGR